MRPGAMFAGLSPSDAVVRAVDGGVVGQVASGVEGELSGIPVLVSTSPLQLNPAGDRGAVVLAQEIRALKAAEAELRAARDAEAGARRDAEAANRSKSAFLANMSHELRTPLNAIIGYAELLGEDLQDAGDEEVVADLSRVEQSARYLLRLIDDILDLSKVDAGRLEVRVEDVPVARVLGELAPTGEALCRRQGNRFQLEPGAGEHLVRADPIRLRQILLNLVSNAAKFTNNGSVVVRVVTEPERVGVEVSDTGIGMDADQLAGLFGRFNQVHRTDHARYGGTGLGLALSRDLARLMGGDLHARSEQGVGSAFTVWLSAVDQRGSSSTMS